MKYELKGRVRFSEVDEQDHMTVAALINYMQDCCTFHSEDHGYALERLRREKMGWFLMSWKIELHQLPQMGTEISVKTWVGDYKGLIANRWFSLEDERGNIIARVLSIWTLMDLEKLRPMRIPEEMKTSYGQDTPLEGNFGGRKIKAPADGEVVADFSVENIHLDTNHHMNNVRYIEAAKEVLPEDFRIHFLEVEYRKQAVLGDRIYVKRVESDRNLNFPDGVISNGTAYHRSVTVLLTDEQGEIYAIVDFLE